MNLTGKTTTTINMTEIASAYHAYKMHHYLFICSSTGLNFPNFHLTVYVLSLLNSGLFYGKSISYSLDYLKIMRFTCKCKIFSFSYIRTGRAMEYSEYEDKLEIETTIEEVLYYYKCHMIGELLINAGNI